MIDSVEWWVWRRVFLFFARRELRIIEKTYFGGE